jgi:hypothetical protein
MGVDFAQRRRETLNVTGERRVLIGHPASIGMGRSAGSVGTGSGGGFSCRERLVGLLILRGSGKT